MASTEQLEREAEQARARVEETLDELRSRISPGQVLDQLVDYARDGKTGDFLRNLSQQVASNPLPVTLIGAGLAWLIVAGRGSPNGGNGHATAGSGDAARGFRDALGSKASGAGRTLRRGALAAGAAAGGVAQGAQSATSALGESARETAALAGDAAASARDGAQRAYGSAAHGVGQAAHAVGDAASAVRRNVADTGRSVVDLCKEEPLVLAGLGLALGAIVGAALPRSETEDRLMGDSSDELKRRASAAAGELSDAATGEARSEDPAAAGPASATEAASAAGDEVGPPEEEVPEAEPAVVLGGTGPREPLLPRDLGPRPGDGDGRR